MLMGPIRLAPLRVQLLNRGRYVTIQRPKQTKFSGILSHYISTDIQKLSLKGFLKTYSRIYEVLYIFISVLSGVCTELHADKLCKISFHYRYPEIVLYLEEKTFHSSLLWEN